jgi:methyltransferase (TIGR00027 family)
MVQKRIETTTSRTAEWTCLSRALSSLETARKCYRGDDSIAVLLLPKFLRLLLHIPWAKSYFSRVAAPQGMYEYVIARTKYIDAVFKEVLADRFEQILIFGAGFDTRALRFQEAAGTTKIFELDVPITQEAKIRQYQKRGLNIPSNVVFVQIDFDKESLSARLEEAGFGRFQRSLFVLEGLLMYLRPESVAETFRTIRDFAGKGSEIVFDYIYASVLRHEGQCPGEKKIVESVAKAGEEWHFGIEQGEIERFLSTYDLRLRDHRNGHALEEMYFKDAAGTIVGRVNGTHCLARAVKM